MFKAQIYLLLIVLFFVAKAAAEAEAEVVAAGTETETKSSTGSTVGVLIIGAGPSGISAARKIIDNGINDFDIFEASHRIGGRMYTVYNVSGIQGTTTPLEMGCFYWQNENLNSLYPIAVQAGINIPSFDIFSSSVFQDGQELDAEEVMAINDKTIKALDNAQIELGVTSQEALIKGGYKYDRQIETTLQYYLEQAYGDNLEVIDSTGVEDPYGNSTQNEPGNYGFAPGGYVQILNYLINQTPSFSNKIRFGMVVTKIDYTDPTGKIVVYYNDTNTGKQTKITATQGVILTVPLGVLKAGSIEFVPPLPSKRQQAIRDLRFGLANKMFLIFDSRGGKILSHPSYSTNNLFRIGKGTNLRYEDPITFFLNYQTFMNIPVVSSFVQGDFARRWEGLSNSQLLGLHMKALREFIPNLPDPVNYIVTRWGSNPYALGSYTFYGRATSVSNVTEFQNPLGNKQNLIFAGEHTQPQEIGTANNAYDSGQFAGTQLLQAIAKYG